MIRIRWTTIALDQFKNISYRIEKDRDLATANRVCRTVYDAIQTLQRYPFSGRPGDEEGTRELVVSQTPYLVAYRVVEPEAIQILHIWHGAQDWRESL